VYETDGIDTLAGPDGFAISLWDIEYLVSNLSLLPPRQRQAIQFCLIENMKETDAAVRMGVSPTNPVAMYAGAGLTKLVALIHSGALPRFQDDAREREAG
jgi:hypothetical protein